MCNFWSGIITRTGKVYSLGEIVSHERIVEKYNLSDRDDNFARFEIVPKKEFGYLNSISEKNWSFVLDESENPSWWSKKQEFKCWSVFEKWFDSEEGKMFKSKFKKFKKLNKENEKKVRMSGEQLIHRTKLLPSHEKFIVEYYLLGEKESWASVRASVWASVWDSVRASVWASVWDSVWDSVRASVWDSVRDSVRASVRASVWDSVRDSVRASVWASVWDSVRDSVRASVWDSVWDSVRASVRASVWDSQFNKKLYPLVLPKKIFDLGYIHCLVREKDGVRKIHVYGKKGKLLKKINFKNNEGV